MGNITIGNDLNKIKQISPLINFRLLFVLFFVGIMAFNATVNGQKTIDLKLENVTLKDILNNIEKKSNYIFIYNSSVFNSSIRKSISVKNESIENVLNLLFKELNVNYRLDGKQVFIYKKEEKKELKTTDEKPNNNIKNIKISGIVIDENKIPVIGANVIILGSNKGVATDLNGIFNIEASENDILKVTYIGYSAKEVQTTSAALMKIQIEPATKELKEIQVTAQVRGQIKAINKQLNSNEIMNAVSAERIQELPDANAAETVARLPGVSLQRDGGEGSKLVIRGLEPKYNKVTIEGVSMASTGGDDRSVDMSMISPYSLDGIEVTKAITADKDADYMGGSVNFKLRKADPGFKSNIIVQGGYNHLRNSISNYMMVGNVGNRFLNNKIGIYLQANAERRNLSSNDLNAAIGFFRTPELNKENVMTTGGLTMTDNYRTRNRYGATLVMDYRLPNGSIQFNNMLSQSQTAANGFAEMFTNGRTHEYDTSDSKNFLLTLTNVLDYTQHVGKFDLAAKVSRSMSNNNTPKAINFHYVQNGGLSSNVYDNPISPAEMLKFATINDNEAYLTSVSSGSGLSRQTQYEGSFDLKYNFEITKEITGNIKGGFKFRRIFNDYNYDVYSGVMNLGSGTEEKDAILTAFPRMQEIAPLGSSLLPYYLFENKNSNHGSFLNGQFTMGPYGDVALMNQTLDILSHTALKQTGISEAYHYNDFLSNTSDYSGDEFLKAGYLMTELKFGSKLTFIPGVRFEENTTQYSAPRGNSYLPFPDFKYKRELVTESKSDYFLLPMIHLKYSPVKWFNVRLAYTETLSRPNFNAITPRWDIGSNVVVWNNYKLTPEHAKNFDAYFSFFDAKFGLFTIGGFAKNIENKIFATDKRVIIDPKEYGLPDMTQYKFIYTNFNNTNLSQVQGIELDWQTTFWYLTGALKGLILNVNYTWIHSQAQYPRTVVTANFDPNTFETTYTNKDQTYTAPLVFQPKKILNISLGYDYKKFSARVSMLYQTKVFQGPNFWSELVNYSDDYVRWDISLKQELPWYGIQVFCNLNNINNAKDVLRNVRSGYASSIQHYGSTIDLGLRLNIDPKKNKKN